MASAPPSSCSPRLASPLLSPRRFSPLATPLLASRLASSRLSPRLSPRLASRLSPRLASPRLASPRLSSPLASPFRASALAALRKRSRVPPSAHSEATIRQHTLSYGDFPDWRRLAANLADFDFNQLYKPSVERSKKLRLLHELMEVDIPQLIQQLHTVQKRKEKSPQVRRKSLAGCRPCLQSHTLHTTRPRHIFRHATTSSRCRIKRRHRVSTPPPPAGAEHVHTSEAQPAGAQRWWSRQH